MAIPQMSVTSIVWSLWSLFLANCAANRVLFMPIPIPSHSNYHVDIARTLKGRGHETWLVLTDSVMKKDILNTTGLNIIQYHTTYSIEHDFAFQIVDDFREKSVPLATFYEKFKLLLEEILGNETLYQEMKAVDADLFVFDDDEAFSKMFVVFPYRLGIPFACLDFTFQPFYRRVPFSPAAVPAFMSGLSPHMTLLERLKNTYLFLVQFLIIPWILHGTVARYAPEKTYVPLPQLLARAEVWLIGSDHILQYPEPTLPNVKYIGGFGASPAKPLDQKFQSFMDSGKDGVIIVSFGSMVLNVPQVFTDKLMAVFLRLRPMKVVFRVNMTSPDPNDVLTSSWLPQNSLLAHPNCKVLISHCGISSQYQALYHAVPVLGLPLFYDQEHNAATMQHKGYGISLDIRKASVEDLVNAIQKLIQKPDYKVTLTKASRLFKELYGNPAETAAYWLDHVMKYGGDYMRSSGQEMPLYQFLMLDVLAILVGCGCVLVVIVCWCGGCVYNYKWCYRRKVKTEKRD